MQFVIGPRLDYARACFLTCKTRDVMGKENTRERKGKNKKSIRELLIFFLLMLELEVESETI